MFTFGIFTTNLPYITMVAFYAYFLIVGLNQASEGKIKIAEKSITVQIHQNNSCEHVTIDTFCFYSSLAECLETDIFEHTNIKQKWKYFGVDKIFKKNHLKSSLFSRPPPTLA